MVPVLTFNPADEVSNELATRIMKSKMLVFLSRVEGFSIRPELRIRPHDWIQGVHEIVQYLEDEYKMALPAVRPTQ